ncbi:LacI family DNA-binding transcriptional regulator [Ovoidimarina sediminis]|uniref:LacI family DNA-binding transcriptional regulator n=1 Tax=Ovoidimarina sediminis TaxID=3079856 RepID=UPI0029109B31|nr:LacI family DNA-binding transcriptional regulator [Rhodophyticola sp. MJ-SS7]MDU8943427.1 LacI family DNA-binding transcriptional regulator [Rhodophyticola sp. MJ-SS7]
MTERKVTSLDVAALAGVSQSAVSRVFTPGASVSKKMEERVRRAADALGYRPNVLARSLITGRSRIIGLVVGYLENQFYPDALERLSTALQAKGYHILVFMTEGSQSDGGEVIQDLLDYQVDGLVTASVGMTDDLAARCEAAGIPVVLFNRGQDDPRLNEVTSDNTAGAREVAKFLVAGGHRRIAHISGWHGSSTGRERAAAFRASLEELGQRLLAEETGAFSREGAAEAARRLMREAKPDAIFVGNDHMAFAVMDVLRFEMGIDVPGEVSVVGYDDVALAGWPAYDLTTLRQPSGAMVEATVDILMDRLEGRATAPQKRRIAGTLMVRGSARVPDGWEQGGAR